MIFNSEMSYRVRLFFVAALVVMCSASSDEPEAKWEAKWDIEAQAQVKTSDEPRRACDKCSVAKVLQKCVSIWGVIGWTALPAALITTVMIDGINSSNWDSGASGFKLAQSDIGEEFSPQIYVYCKSEYGQENGVSEEEAVAVFKKFEAEHGISGINVPMKYYFPTWDKLNGYQVKVLEEANGVLYETFSAFLVKHGQNPANFCVQRGGVFPFIDTDVSYGALSDNLSTPVKRAGFISAINISICSITTLALIDASKTPNKKVGVVQALFRAAGMLSMALMTDYYKVDINQAMHALTLYACMGLSLFGITPSVVATLMLTYRFKDFDFYERYADENVDLPAEITSFEKVYGFKIVEGKRIPSTGKRIPSSQHPEVTAVKLCLTAVFVGIWKFTSVEWNALCELLAIMFANSSFYTHYMKIRCEKILSYIPTLTGHDGQDVTNTILALREDAGVQGNGDEEVILDADKKNNIKLELEKANSQAEVKPTDEDLTPIEKGQRLEMMRRTIAPELSEERASSSTTTPRLKTGQCHPKLEAVHSTPLIIDNIRMLDLQTAMILDVDEIDGLMSEERDVLEKRKQAKGK